MRLLHAQPRRFGLSAVRTAIGAVAYVTPQLRLLAHPHSNRGGSIVLAPVRTAAEPMAVCAHYFTPAAVIEDRHPCA